METDNYVPAGWPNEIVYVGVGNAPVNCNHLVLSVGFLMVRDRSLAVLGGTVFRSFRKAALSGLLSSINSYEITHLTGADESNADMKLVEAVTWPFVQMVGQCGELSPKHVVGA